MCLAAFCVWLFLFVCLLVFNNSLCFYMYWLSPHSQGGGVTFLQTRRPGYREDKELAWGLLIIIANLKGKYVKFSAGSKLSVNDSSYDDSSMYPVKISTYVSSSSLALEFIEGSGYVLLAALAPGLGPDLAPCWYSYWMILQMYGVTVSWGVGFDTSFALHHLVDHLVNQDIMLNLHRLVICWSQRTRTICFLVPRCPRGTGCVLRHWTHFRWPLCWL